MKMLKTLALAVLTPTLIKAAEEGYEWVCKQFGECEDISPKTKKVIRKSPDTYRLVPQQKTFIRREFRSYLKDKKTTSGIPIQNTDELAAYFNTKFSCHKSRSTYAKIWKVK